jgi:glycosyltransferase involved in cell wall biosynthesis
MTANPSTNFREAERKPKQASLSRKDHEPRQRMKFFRNLHTPDVPRLPDDKTKIVRIIARLNIGGPAIHVVNLTAGLDRSCFEQLLVVGTESPAEGSMMDYALSRGVQPHVLPEIVTAFSLTLRDVKAVAKLYGLMRRHRPHIVHTHTAKAGLLGRLAARMARVPIVLHTYHGHVLHGYYGRVKSWLLRRMEQALARITDRLVTVSEQVKTELVAYGVARAEKITVIPLGFDLESFLASSVQRGQFRQEIGLNGAAKLIGIVGRLFPIKNHRLFLDAAAKVTEREPATRFVIVGDGVLRSALEQRAKELGISKRVFFIGWRRDLPRIYADLDVLVVSSDNEGTPVSAIEAMAAGCPVVATCVGGLPDLITDQTTGLLVRARDADGLANAVLHLLHNPELARTIGHKGRIAAQERFSMDRLLTDIDQLYRQLLAARTVSYGTTTHSLTQG